MPVASAVMTSDARSGGPSPQTSSGERARPSPVAERSLPTLRAAEEASAGLADLGRFVRDIVRDELAAERRRQVESAPRAPRSAPATDSLAAAVLDAARQVLGDDQVAVDAQGDIPIPREGAQVFVRVLDEPASVLVFCPVIVDLPSSPALLDQLNRLNEGVRFVRFCATENGVVVDLEIFGDGFEAQMLHLAVRAVAGAAARFGPELADALGGRLFVDADRAGSHGPATAGYL
jgi:hypothetical protein